MEGLVSINGKVTPVGEARLSALDRGFLLGDSIFEVMVGFGNQVLDPEAHLQRLRESAAMTGMKIPWSDEQLTFAIQDLLSRTGFPKSWIRLAVSRGTGTGLRFSPDLEPNLYIYCLPATLQPPEVYETGIRLKRRAQGFTLRGATPKSANYLRSIHALSQAAPAGFDDVLWTNADGEITEASTANIFLIGRSGDLVEIATPPAGSGLLLGITRMTMIDLLNNARIPVTERIIHQEELPRFDEAFVTSTVRGLVPVSAIDQHKLHTRRRQSVFNQIERLFLTRLESILGIKTDWNSGQALEGDRN